jgi:YidC/Oxa1 family membrane protein insertase
MDNQRLILFIALSMVLMLLWQSWEQQYAPPPPVSATAPGTPAPGDSGVPVAPPAADGSAPAAPGADLSATQTGQRITVTTDVYIAEIDTLGGDLKRLALRKHPAKAGVPDVPFELLSGAGSELYITQTGLFAHNAEWPNHRSVYQADKHEYVLPAGQDSVQVPLSWVGPNGLRVVKTYTFQRDSYAVKLNYAIHNGGKQAAETYFYAQILRSHVEQKSMLSAAPSYVGGAIYTPAEKYEKITFDDMTKKPLSREVKGGWVAMLQHYFVGAWMPPADSVNTFYGKTQDDGRHVIGYKTTTASKIAPGQNVDITTTLYAGPKEHKRLLKQAAGMDLTVDYGWLTIIAAPLFDLLHYIHGWVGNWGWAIIILTIIIKLVFYPLSATSYRSMANMRRVQPKMQSIKERYADDKQKQQQAMMELYKTEKINPLGGCLPIVVQIPVFISLYWVLLESVEMRQAPFALWITDLSSADPYFVLPVLMGVTMLATQLLSPQMGDPLQRKVMMALPVVFTVFFAFFPAGLVLYWVVQNLLSIVQQWMITRQVEAGVKK